jgi:hypothetical protein
LAAVLAGFMINGIVLVLGSRPKDITSRYVLAVSLLFAAFVALGLDAYLFGLVTGDTTQIIDHISACRRTWTEAMFAAGLLGLGAVAIVVGFVVLFDAYLSNVKIGKVDAREEAPRDEAADRRVSDKEVAELNVSLLMLQALCNFLRRAVAFIVLGLLWMASRSYLSAVFNGHAPIVEQVFVYTYIGLLGLVIVVVTGGALAKHDYNNFLTRFQSGHPIKALRIAIYCSVVYSVGSVALGGITASLPISIWGPANPWARGAISTAVIWVLVVSLVPLVLLLVCTVPDFGSTRNPRSSPSAPDQRADRSLQRQPHQLPQLAATEIPRGRHACAGRLTS